MSFLAPDKIPFTIVAVNPTVGGLDQAIQDNLATGSAVSAANNSTINNPQLGVIIGDGDTVEVINTGTDPSAILVTGLGSTAFISGTIDIQGTNLGGGAVIIETNQVAEEDFGVKQIAFSSGYSDINGIIDTTTLVGGNDTYTNYQSIAEAAGDQIPVPGFTFYGHAGSGDDLLTGSNYSDFLRGGAGSDQISAFGGDDLVRGGAGSDEIFLGTGMDTVYYTSDQMNSTDTLGDFVSGEDKITFDSSLDIDSSDITGFGSSQITVSSTSGTVTIVSDGDEIQESDIDFV